MTQKINVGMVSLGCDKNRVDAEQMLGILSNSNFNIVNDESKADVIIINTCGFIETAKQESINTILELSKNKKNGKCKGLIATGCLAERYSNELLSEIPELDAVVGVGNYMEIVSVIDSILSGDKGIKKTDNINYDINIKSNRILTTPSYTAYVKISEGCNNNCSYCIIPKLRGIYRSRPMENIQEEIQMLSNDGVKEVILVAQDTTKYGIDLYGKKMLTQLIRNISKIDGLHWIRLLYCYPEDIDDELIQEISTNERVCKYIDIPIQHINNDILKRMRRLSNKSDIESLIVKLRKSIPEIIIRTSLIVGFPGETEEQFNELYNFLSYYKLDRVGVFPYSQEEQTDAANFDNQINDKIKKIRQKKLLELQKKISHNKNLEKIGRNYEVLIEKVKDGSVLIGRTYGDAPEIDGTVCIKNESDNNYIGEFVSVKIIDSHDYDLIGEIIHESGK